METIKSDCSQQLCARAKAGELDAATQLVSPHYQKVYAFLRRLCGNDDDAAELTQKTFSKIWAALGSYEGRSAWKRMEREISEGAGADIEPACAKLRLRKIA
jgi:RNA polymerase sigma-70 factor (ECF subfamily)